MQFNSIPTMTQWQIATAMAPGVRAAKPALLRIDQLIFQYHRVPDMARLNILMELKNAIVDWVADKIDRDKTANRLATMQALHEVVIRKLIELDGWAKHRYTKVACLGYVVRPPAYDPKKKAPPIVRRSHESAELINRCAELVLAIQSAQQKWVKKAGILGFKPEEDRRTLKIFMAPEFYFRGPFGAYRDPGAIAKIFEEMRQETGKAQYADWLFVLGSAVVCWDDGQGDLALGNYGLVQQGGPKNGSNLHEFAVAKEFPSHIDFKHEGITDGEWYDPAKTKATVGGETKKVLRTPGARLDPYQQGINQGMSLQGTAPVSELAEGCIFTKHGITFGLEVCRDHLLGRLAHGAQNLKVQIQLIPSYGASIEQPACMADGIVFNVDGDTPEAQRWVRQHGRKTETSKDKITLFDPVSIPYPGVNQGAAWTRATPLAVANKLKIPLNTLAGRPV